MVERRVTPQELISGKLRQNLTDYNATARAGAGLSPNWIYPDKPRIENLEAKIENFPRVGVTEMPISSAGDIGIGGSETEDTINLLINIYTIKEKLVKVETTTGEDIVHAGGEVDYTLDSVPLTKIDSVSPAVTSIAVKDISGDGRYNGITLDASANTYSVDYSRELEGTALATFIAQDIHAYLRDNWRDDIDPTLYDYLLVNNKSLSSMNDRVQRRELQVKFSGINIGD